MSKLSDAATVRRMLPEEKVVIMYSWTKYLTPSMSREDAETFINNKLDKAQAWVADVDGVVLSVVVIDGPTVVYAYTKATFKRSGLVQKILTVALDRYKPIIAASLPLKPQLRKKFKWNTEIKLYVCE